MAYNPDDPNDVALLKGEVETDPINMGYDPFGKTKDILDLLNLPENNVAPQTTSRIFDAQAMLDALVPSDFNISQTLDGTEVYTLTLLQGEINGIDIEPYKDRWRDLFPANSDTVANLDAQSAELSRGEVLFGQLTVITRQEWIAARDS